MKKSKLVASPKKDVVNIKRLIDDARCYQTVRNMRWPTGNISCPHCGCQEVSKNGHHKNKTERQKYFCKTCGRHFDDLTNTIFEGHHQSLSVWILCLYFMGLNLSNRQIALELDLSEGDVQKMTSLLRAGIVDKKPDISLSQEVECDEVYIVAGHKGHPEIVKKTDVKAEGTD